MPRTLPATRRDFLRTMFAGSAGLALFGSRNVFADDVKIAGTAALGDPREKLPLTLKAIEAGLTAGLHIGAQLYVSRGGKPVADFGLGEGRKGVAMNQDSMMVWFSSTKPTTAVSTLKQWERGKFDLDDKVVKYIPSFGANGKESITIRHLLTHSAGIPNAIKNWFAPWSDCIAEICASKPEPDWVPGKKMAYHPVSSWHILGEIVRLTSDKPYTQFVRDEVFLPLGMQDSWVGMPEEKYKQYGERLGEMYATTDGKVVPTTLMTLEQSCLHCIPGGSGRGPIRELGYFYEMLQGRGTRNGVKILAPQTVEAMTAWQRTALKDPMPKQDALGLCVFLDAHIYGKFRSPRSFGHSGAASSVAFCDPDNDIVIAMVFNGMCAGDKHNQRLHDVSTAIYTDLGIAK